MYVCIGYAVQVVKLAERGVPGEAYNVGTGQSISTQDLLDIILKQSTKNVSSINLHYRLYYHSFIHTYIHTYIHTFIHVYSIAGHHFEAVH